MRAAVTTEPNRIEVRDVPAAVPGPGEVLVAVERVGLCGSDIHLFTGEHPYSNFPQTLGHEFSGVIVEIGTKGGTALTIGDRVAVDPFSSCGTCYPCRTGHSNCCVNLDIIGVHRPGALQTQIVVPAINAHVIGDLSPELGALCEPVAIALQAVARGGVERGERVLVLGAGPIGQAITVASSEMGAQVMVSDLVENRLTIALEMGAEETVSASSDDLSERVRSWTGGEGPPLVFDATGVPAVIRQGFDLVAPSGRLVIVGLNNDDVAFPVVEFTRRELAVLGSRGNGGRFPEAVELVRRNANRIVTMITQRYALEDAEEALRFAHDHPAETVKVQVEIGDG